ncbi:MAG: gliding motility-associated C-terminal domain-containing protein [Lentimicrobiaceae bacterium]|nr:gliding motility-associated C-terminal domain-containing protein [Lentimicrobiaceae bacterium]MCB9024144.1 gliding motility-associated C-terminal domain-containing protein [Lentimicrobiaceae bacterium]MCO5264928.1 gliding motility-associated C-terminal domain-containing protein [Lentimicrobium sp.]
MMKQSALLNIVFLFAFTAIFTSGNTAYSQNATTSINGGVYCPDNELIIPVAVADYSNVDSIYLKLNFPVNTLTYLSYRLPNTLLETGFLTVNASAGTVIIIWHSIAPVSISSGNLLQLIFRAGSTPGAAVWDTETGYLHQAGGGQLLTDYVDAEFEFLPKMSVVLEELDATCSGKCDANIAASVSGGARPYHYLWNGQPALFDSIKTQACSGNNILSVTDDNGCVLDTTFIVSELPATKIEAQSLPDTVYIQNPVVRFSFTEDLSIVDWIWDFGDGSEKSRERIPVHVFSSAQTPDLDAYIVTLTAINELGCDTVISMSIPIAEAEVHIPNVFTPPTDPNGTFKIAKKNDSALTDSEFIPIVNEFMRVEVIIIDRWGRRVYHNTNYKNDWDGDNLPDGTYFYKVNTFGYFKDRSYTGAVTIIREKN